MTETDPAQPVTKTSRGAFVRSVYDWMTLAKPIRSALALESENAGAREFLARAVRAKRAADRLLDPPDAVLREPELSHELYRQAAYWLGRATRPSAPEDAPLADLLPLGSEADVNHRLPAPSADVATGLAEPFWARFDRPPEQRLARARATQDWIGPTIEAALRALSPLAELRLKRALRVGPLLLVACLLFVTGAVVVWRAVRGPDLAEGRSWRTSSKQYDCDPVAESCGGVRTKIFFHTREEANPWFEVDLGKLERVSRVEIVNRGDEYADRAVPLIVELSTDGRSYRSVAERRTPFTRWNPSFERTQARFVRLRAARQTILHLEHVSIRR
jgi:hypothetical protein